MLWGWDGLSGDRVVCLEQVLPQQTEGWWIHFTSVGLGGVTGICHAVQADPMGLEMPYLCVVLNNW